MPSTPDPLGQYRAPWDDDYHPAWRRRRNVTVDVVSPAGGLRRGSFIVDIKLGNLTL
jgi:hypothetical protein